jgi:RNA polymerase sigma-70 factor, ECF subfamily
VVVSGDPLPLSRAFHRNRFSWRRLRPAADATTVKIRDGELIITDGPYSETKEQVAGYDLLECSGLDEAVRWAGKHPSSWAGAIEVRALPEHVLAVRVGAVTDGPPPDPAGGTGEAPAADVRDTVTATSVVGTVVADAFRAEWGRIIAALIHQTGDWDLAEECTQDAIAQALLRWPRDGVPNRPGAWLMTVARNGAVDRLRRGSTYRAKVQELAVMASRDTGPGNPEPEADDSGVPDERLRLIFTCCHPALAMEARVALTLRTLTGLSTAEIAHAFLVPEATMAKRLVRAKQKIANARIPYRVPPASALPERVPGVLAVLYLVFNEGYSASAGDDLIRRDLCDRAVAMAGVLADLLPEEPEARGLLALMLFHRARQSARVTDDGDLVTLEDQDRTRWDQAQIGLARRHLTAALAGRQLGQYQVQAAIAGCHAAAATARATDWPRIARLYQYLADLTGSPVVELNRAVAVAMADGPEAGLALLRRLEADGALAGYYLLPATRADFLRRLGRNSAAATACEEAAGLAASEPPSAGT